ncbi:MAG: YdcF family protein [Trueperaceae bacterium]|nr:YdcF family protein [Trueperaceae bacterium]
MRSGRDRGPGHADSGDASSGPRVVRLLVWAPLLLLALLAADVVGIVAGPPTRPDCTADAALVMGAAQYDGRPSPVFERRLHAALELYEVGCVERIVVSGGSRPGDRTTEGDTGVRWLADRGVPETRLLAETRSTTSAENVWLSASLLGDGPLLIVTDDLHAWRAVWLARRFGLDASAHGVPTGIVRPSYVLRELTAMASYRVGWVR